MTKKERDKLIVEELGGGYDLIYFNLSTPAGFFWVWDRAKEKEWWKEFINAGTYSNSWNLVKLIHPDHFADALAEFLMQRQDESHAALPRHTPEELDRLIEMVKKAHSYLS